MLPRGLGQCEEGCGAMSDNSSVPYSSWLADRSEHAESVGIECSDITPALFDHQKALVKWALRRGRAAIFADTGLGKTAMQLEWARHVSKVGKVLILAPLAVAHQTVKEGVMFGIDVTYARETCGADITITNYEMLHHFDPSDYIGIVLDESSILKSFTGKTRNMIIDSFANTKYRLACTATPAPNDFTELGNHSEFLGIKSRVEMLAEYFVHDGGSTQNWRLKGHAVVAFWEWLTTWGAVIRSPRDLGYDASGYDLPPMVMHEHPIAVTHQDAWSEGLLFAPEARTLSESRTVRRATLEARIEKTVELCIGNEPAIVWCEMNKESSLAAKSIDGAIEVAGSHTLDEKRERLEAFASGKYRVLVTKPKICGFGLNWQHCNRMVFVGASYSYEQTYQAIRRCWRFGQSSEVNVHILRAETEAHVIAAYRRKERDAEIMAEEVRSRVGDSISREVLGQESARWNEYEPKKKGDIPSWMF